jgi:hypothetical protein
MTYVYKTKSLQERMNLLSTLIDRYGSCDTPALLRGIETEEDWLKYPYVQFNTNFCYVNLTKDCGGYHEIGRVERFMDVCGIPSLKRYNDFTITKHRFI